MHYKLFLETILENKYITVKHSIWNKINVNVRHEKTMVVIKRCSNKGNKIFYIANKLLYFIINLKWFLEE